MTELKGPTLTKYCYLLMNFKINERLKATTQTNYDDDMDSLMNFTKMIEELHNQMIAI